MNFVQRDGGVEITDISDFDLAKTFECGQCFRWNANPDGSYTGIAFGCAVNICYGEGGPPGVADHRETLHGGAGDSSGSVIISCSAEDFNAVWRDYFDLDRDYAEIRSSLCVDDFMRMASASGAGIRILRQDAWEALCSFIISQCNNIPRIKKIIASLCERFGDSIRFDGGVCYSFPSAQMLASCDEDDLAPIRCGYRAAYILDAAKAVAGGSLDLGALAKGSPERARAALTALRGVGVKVADCALLYGLHMLDSFPLDVWIKRAVAAHYGECFDPGIFSPYAGIAQQYMYHYMRNMR